ncbi:hypothetical protein [Streptomyces sp. NPDC093111]|uniref:hypothetical protein n=1 Tax=Streptomyces sp. NPDC093111 TaxID=3154978 RepID=UPI003442A7C2
MNQTTTITERRGAALAALSGRPRPGRFRKLRHLGPTPTGPAGTERPCLICHHATAAPRTACGRCEGGIRAMLREIDAQRPLLADLLTPGSAPAGPRTAATGRAHSPMPVRGDVLTLLGAGATTTVPDPHGDQSGPAPLDALLEGWAAAVAAELPELDATPLRRSGTTWSQWLTAYLPQIATAHWADTLHSELTAAVRRIRSMTATEPRRRPQDAPCPSCTAFALFATDWAPYIDCEACGLLLTPSEYETHARTTLPNLARLAILITAAHHTTASPAA